MQPDQQDYEARVREILRTCTFVADNQPYAVTRLPARGITAAAGVIAEIGEPFLALIADADEVTLVIPTDALEEFERRLRGHEAMTEYYRLLTCDAVLPPDLIGFMARISAILAEASVTILPFAAYSRDHVLVPQSQFDQAVQALRQAGIKVTEKTIE